MKTRILLISCLLVFVFGCNLLPNVNALIFDIGTKINENDLEMYTFSSGVVVMTDADYINYVPSIFDGNTSTGINHNFGSGHQSMRIELFFPYSFNISNITVKPDFGGGTTTISSFSVAYKHYTNEVYFNINKNTTFQINCTLDGIGILLNNGGTNQFYFNDVIINYTINLTDLNAVNQALNIIQNSINSLQNQINNFEYHFNELNTLIIELNNSIANINQTQQKVLENITNLWNSYQKLNESIINLYKEIENLNKFTQENITNLWTNYNQLNNSLINLSKKIEKMNLTTYNNITQLESDLLLIQNNITDIQKDLNNLSLYIDKLPEIQSQINQTTFNINNLNENITGIKNTLPSQYNDTALKNRVTQLESENTILKNEIDKLKLNLDELKDKDDDEDEDKGEVNALTYGGIGLGILGVILALVAITMLLTKRGPQVPPKIKEVPTTTIEPEQPVLPETETISQEQPQVTPEVQKQEDVQMQQQEGLG